MSRSLAQAQEVHQSLHRLPTAIGATPGKFVFPEIGLTVPAQHMAKWWPFLPFAVTLARHSYGAVQCGADGRPVVSIAGLRLPVSTPQELHIVHEVFVEEIYRVEPGSVHVWEIGANTGFASLYFAHVLGATVTAFELFPELAARAEALLEANSTPGVKVHALGVARTAGELELEFFPESAGSNGLFGNHAPDRAGTARLAKVRLISVEEAFKLLESDANAKPIFAKIDCEGAEYQIVEALAETGLLKRLAGCVIELHETGGDPNQLVAHLVEAGFLVHRQPSFHQGTAMLWAARQA